MIIFGKMAVVVFETGGPVCRQALLSETRSRKVERTDHLDDHPDHARPTKFDDNKIVAELIDLHERCHN